MEVVLMASDRIDEMIIDKYESFIFTERYNEPGDFQLKLIHTHEIFKVENLMDCYIRLQLHDGNDENRIMFIETIETEWDPENHLVIILSGRSLSSVLGRRIIWSPVVLTKLEPNAAIKKLIDDNIINATPTARRIPNFIYKNPTKAIPRNYRAPDGTSIDRIVTEDEFKGENLLDVITDYCKTWEIGYKVYPRNGVIDPIYTVFQLYEGVENDVVSFSHLYNLVQSDYEESSVNFKNVALVVGEDPKDDEGNVIEGAVGKNKWVNSKLYKRTPAYWHRREMFVDAKSITQEHDKTDAEGNVLLDGEGNPIRETYTDEEYYNVLSNEAIDHLEEDSNKYINAFNGEVDSSISPWKYGIDYYLGDIVWVENEFGIRRRARIIEYTYSMDSDYIKEYPTFEVIQTQENLWLNS